MAFRLATALQPQGSSGGSAPRAGGPYTASPPSGNQLIPADDLGRAMVDVAVRPTRQPEALILENRDIRAMASPLTLSPELHPLRS
jgi:hypothetical protein